MNQILYSLRYSFSLCAFVVLMIASNSMLAQYKCQSKVEADGTRSKCFHANMKVSTLEFWDKDKREGSFEAWNNKGELLVKFELRRYAGHASVDAYYYPNGQVSKVEYSSAPDGGIQYWHYIYYYNDQGIETSRVDLSAPDGFPRVPVPDHLRLHEEEQQNPSVVIPAKPSPPKDTRVSGELVVLNVTGKKVSTLYKAVDDSTAKKLDFDESTGNAFSDTLMLDPSILDKEWCSIQIIGRQANKYRCEQMLSSGNKRIYILTRKPRG